MIVAGGELRSDNSRGREGTEGNASDGGGGQINGSKGSLGRDGRGREIFIIFFSCNGLNSAIIFI